MNYAETVAKRLLEHVVSGSRMEYCNSQSSGEYDFTLYHPDGRRNAAVEVTALVDEELTRTHKKVIEEPPINATLSKKGWWVDVVADSNTRVRKLRKKLDRYLAKIEAAGIEDFYFLSSDEPAVETTYHELGVVRGRVLHHLRPASITLLVAPIGGAFGPSTAIEAAETAAWKNDNRTKRGVGDHPEYHFAAYIPSTSFPASALTDFEPPDEEPHLPPEMSDIWMFTEASTPGKWIVWKGGRSRRWEKLTVTLTEVPHSSS